MRSPVPYVAPPAARARRARHPRRHRAARHRARRVERADRRPALPVACVPRRAARHRLRGAAHRLDAALPDRVARPRRSSARCRSTQGAQLWRVRVRLGVGRSVSPARTPLLPEAALPRCRSRRFRARACCAPDRATRRALLEHAIALVQAGRYSSLHVLYPPAGGSRRRRSVRPGATAGRAVPLDQSGLSRLRGFPCGVLARQAQEGEAGAPQARRGRRHVRAQAGAGDITRRRLGLLLPVLRKHVSRAPLDAVPVAGVLRAHRRPAARSTCCSSSARATAGACARRWTCSTRDTLWGRYWGTTEYVPGLHFEACYYQAIEFCIEQRIARFEGGAQGLHKLARGLAAGGHALAAPGRRPGVRRRDRRLLRPRARRRRAFARRTRGLVAVSRAVGTDGAARRATATDADATRQTHRSRSWCARLRRSDAMLIYYTDHFVLPLPPGHRFPMAKYRDAARTGGKHRRRTPARAPRRHRRGTRARARCRLRRTPPARGTLAPAAQRRIGFPWSPAMIERSRRSAGATIAACRSALARGLRRQSRRRHASCASRAWRRASACSTTPSWRPGPCRPRAASSGSLIVDLDVHQGDGTAAIVAGRSLDLHVLDARPRQFPVPQGQLRPRHRVRRRHRRCVVPAHAGRRAAARARRGQTAARDLSRRRRSVRGRPPGKARAVEGGTARRATASCCRRCTTRGIGVAIAMAGGYAENIDDIVDIHFATVLAALDLYAPGVTAASRVGACRRHAAGASRHSARVLDFSAHPVGMPRAPAPCPHRSCSNAPAPSRR